MYQINLQNQSKTLTVQVADGSKVEPGGRWSSSPQLGNIFMSTQQFGTINFTDIGDQHIPGDSKETWGVLISYQGEEVVGRYEGGGQLNVSLNGYGQLSLSGMDLRQVALPAMTLTH
jgi:hypothetical protein